MSNALNDFVVAAGSYFGLPEGRVVHGSTVETQDGDMVLVVRMVLTTDDVVGIGKRMGVMALEAKVDEVQATAAHFGVEPPSRDTLRAMYNQLPAHQRSAFGSFAKYVAAYGEADAYAQALDKAELPAHVWVPSRELTTQQRAMAVGTVEDGSRYAMDPADLTEEQRVRLCIVLPEAKP